MPTVTLNGKPYSITGKVRRFTVQQLAGVQRNDATVRQGANQKVSSVAWGNLTGGLGKARVREDADFRRVRSSAWETRWPSQVTPSLLGVDTTDDTRASIATVAVEFNGKLWFLTAAASGAVAMNATYFTGSTGRWTEVAVRSLGVANTQSAYDLWTNGVRIFAAFKDGATTGTQVWHSTDGTTSPWTQATLTGIDTAYEDSALIWNSGSTLLLAVGDSSAKSIKVYSSTDNFANVTLEATIVSSSGPKGWATYYDKSGTERPLLGTAEGVYYVNLADDVAVMQFPMAASANNCKRMRTWEGSLYVPVGNGYGGLDVWTWDGAQMNYRNWGGQRDDGVGAGDIICMWPVPGGWLFVGDGTYVYAIDKDGGWHYIATGGDSFVAVTSLDDGTMRLHYVNGVNLMNLTKPLDNPASATGQTFGTSVELRLPDFPAYLANEDKCFLRLKWDGDFGDTSAVAVTYGLDGVTPATSLGTFNSTTKTLTFGSGAGVSGKTLGQTLTHTNSTTSHKATLRELTLEYEVVLPDLEGYVFQVDVAQTAQARAGGTEEVISDLRTAMPGATVPLVTFKYGKRAQTYVRVRGIDGLEEWDEDEATGEGERRGPVTVTAEQVIA